MTCLEYVFGPFLPRCCQQAWTLTDHTLGLYRLDVLYVTGSGLVAGDGVGERGVM